VTDRPELLGPDWLPGPDGLWSRLGARVVLLDVDDRVLLLRGHDLDDPGRSWWFTVGGGIDVGEDARDAAVREAREEVGIVLTRADLVGPVLTRSAIFDFARVTCRQDETFFLARVEAHPDAGSDRSGWTPIELATVDEARWFDLDELARHVGEVYPEGLVGLVAGWLGGWDGSTPHLDAT
jgi:8-oxo-dGTP pyrophosphatase MutT (NUDIX family)